MKRFTEVKVFLFFFIFLSEFLWTYAAKSEEKLEYQCPSVAAAALDSGYTLRASGDDIWELSKKNNGLFYIIENTELCSYEMFANILNQNLEMTKFINAWHKEKFIGKIYKDDDGYIYEHFVILPNASNELLQLNIGAFHNSAADLLISINDHIANINTPKEKSKPHTDEGWFKAYVLACPDNRGSCIMLEDDHGPYDSHKQCYERSQEMVNNSFEILGDGKYSYRCKQII